jgi:hypothetical protein
VLGLVGSELGWVITVVLVVACMRPWKDQETLVNPDEAEDGEIWWSKLAAGALRNESVCSEYCVSASSRTSGIVDDEGEK